MKDAALDKLSSYKETDWTRTDAEILDDMRRGTSFGMKG